MVWVQVERWSYSGSSRRRERVGWPEAVAPFNVHLVAIFDKNVADGGVGKVKKAADDLYAKLTKKGIEVLYD